MSLLGWKCPDTSDDAHGPPKDSFGCGLSATVGGLLGEVTERPVMLKARLQERAND